MYGQLKSTVRCLDCGNISVTFDPFLTLSLPITKPTLFHVAFLPYEFAQKGIAADSCDEDDRAEQFVFTFNINPKDKTTVGDIKERVLKEINQIGERQIEPENLLLTLSKWGEVTEEFVDEDSIDTIDQSGTVKTCFIETHVEPLGEDDKATELNFSKLSLNKKGLF